MKEVFPQFIIPLSNKAAGRLSSNDTHDDYWITKQSND